MAKVRQMPALYLRGSLANITMKNLTKEQKDHIEGVVLKVAGHRDMQRHKNEIMQKLGVTIAADYADDKRAAEEEFHIAIWRGVCDLFYHHKYSFKCKACDSATYTTKRLQPKAIDRVQMPCPNCHQVEISDPGDVSKLQDLVAAGTPYIEQEDFQQLYRDLQSGFAAPKVKSSIVPIPGAAKYTDPQAIIDDDEQLRKFFGEFVWNYFRQQINENKRKENKVVPQHWVDGYWVAGYYKDDGKWVNPKWTDGKWVDGIRGPADYVLLQEVISLCTKNGISYNHCDKTAPVNGHYTVLFNGLYTPPRFSVELGLLKKDADKCEVPFIITAQGVMIKICIAAPERIAVITKPEHVTILDNFTKSSNDDGGDFTISQVSCRTVRGHRMDADNHVEHVDTTDALSVIRDALPDGPCRDFYDICRGEGDRYVEFSNKYGDGKPKDINLATFLGITPRSIKTYKEMISVHMLANGFSRPIKRNEHSAYRLGLELVESDA